VVLKVVGLEEADFAEVHERGVYCCDDYFDNPSEKDD